MNRPRIAPALILVLLAALLAGVSGCQKAGTDAELPDDLLVLLPADPAMLVSLTSLEDWETRRQALADSTHGAPLLEGGFLAELDLAALLTEHLPAAAGVVATDRPLVLALGLPAPLTNQLDMVLVFPVAAGADVGELADGETFHSQMAHGAYLALATAPTYAPADSLPAIALDRVPGLMSMALDLEGIVTMYRPIVEMGLAAAAAMPPAEDGAAPQGSMTPEEAAALGEMLGMVMDSVKRYDLAVDVDDVELSVAGRVELIPGSPLEPGPQPDFARALALTGSLPEDAPVKMALAMDQTRQMDVFADYYLASMTKDLRHLPADMAVGIAKWFGGYLENYAIMNVPMAVGGGFGPEGVELRVVVAAADPAALLAHFEGQLTTLGDLGVGLTVTPAPALSLGVASVRGWDLAWDDQLMADTVAEADVAGVAPTGGQMLQTFSYLRELAPGLRVAEVNGLALITTTTDPTELGEVVADVLDPRGPDPHLADLAKVGGPHTIEAVHGDVAEILATVFEIMHGMEPAETAELRSRPLAVEGVATLDGPRIGFQGSLDVAGLRSAVAAVKHMIAQAEEKHGQKP